MLRPRRAQAGASRSPAIAIMLVAAAASALPCGAAAAALRPRLDMAAAKVAAAVAASCGPWRAVAMRQVVDEGATAKAARASWREWLPMTPDHDSATAAMVTRAAMDSVHEPMWLPKFTEQLGMRGNAPDLASALLHQEGAAASVLAMDVSEDPDLLLVIIFLGFFCIILGKVWIQHGGRAAERSIEVRSHRDSLLQSYSGMVKESETILMGMFESSAYLVEWNFDGRRRSFEKLLNSIAASPERLVGPDASGNALVPFRIFVGAWLQLFEQCSIDPIATPNQIVRDKELDACTTIVSMSNLVLERLQKNEVTFIKAAMEEMKSFEGTGFLRGEIESHKWIECGCFGFGMRTQADDFADDDNEDSSPFPEPTAFPVDCLCGCLKITLMSQTHVLLLMCMVFGIGIIALELVLRKYIMAIGLSVPMVSMVYFLCRIGEIDQYAALAREVHQLRRAANAVSLHHQELTSFTDKLRRLDHIWRLRTIPCMDLLMELVELVMSTAPEEKLPLMQGLCQQLPVLMEGLGPLALWIAEADKSPELLQVAASQLHSCAEFVEAHRNAPDLAALTMRRMSRTFGFLVVRIIGCQELTNKAKGATLGKVVRPYVAIRLRPSSSSSVERGADMQQELRTTVGEKSLNPVWNEEFFISVPWGAEQVELHVHDVGGTSLGYHIFNFRAMPPGVWQKGAEKLRSLKKSSFKKSEIFYEVLFAEQLRQLYNMEELDPPPLMSFLS